MKQTVFKTGISVLNPKSKMPKFKSIGIILGISIASATIIIETEVNASYSDPKIQRKLTEEKFIFPKKEWLKKWNESYYKLVSIKLEDIVKPQTEDLAKKLIIPPIPKLVIRWKEDSPNNKTNNRTSFKIRKFLDRLLSIRPQVIGSYPSGLHPVIKISMLEASKYLPKGYKIRFISAARRHSSVGRRSYHVKREWYKGKQYSLASDIYIIDPKGKRLQNIRAPNNFWIYREFMQATKKIQYNKFPSYRGKGRWGGYFVSGISQDLMHYDLGPENNTQAGNWFNGLKKRFAHFGKHWDIGIGMGNILNYKLQSVNNRGDN